MFKNLEFNKASAMPKRGRERSPLRAVMANLNASVGRQRRAEDCPPYLPRFCYAESKFMGAWLLTLMLCHFQKPQTRQWNWKNHGWTPMDTDENGFQVVHPLDEASAMPKGGRGRSPLRAVVANLNASVGRQRRAEDCPPYRPRFNLAESKFMSACLLRFVIFNNTELHEASAMPKRGRERSPLRAVMANPSASVGRQRRAEDCPPYLPRIYYVKINLMSAWLLTFTVCHFQKLRSQPAEQCSTLRSMGDACWFAMTPCSGVPDLRADFGAAWMGLVWFYRNIQITTAHTSTQTMTMMDRQPLPGGGPVNFSGEATRKSASSFSTCSFASAKSEPVAWR